MNKLFNEIREKIFFCLTNLQKIFEKKENDQMEVEPSKQYSLTPLTINEFDDKGCKNKAYQVVTDIAAKLLDNDVRNIALTGPYGSGKSSVLLTLQSRFKQYNYLNISLATLECNNEIKEENENITSNSPQSKEESLNRLIEYSILQQLIYREKVNTIPQSRFKRIKHISNKVSLRIAIEFVFAIIAVLILFEPKSLQIEPIYSLFSCSAGWKLFWDILSMLYIIVATVFVSKKLITNTCNSKLNKLNLKDGEIDISESTSIFNKHLDEILYFFEVTKYDVVVIEDLDRFDTSNIFLKLRELNYLLNNSKAIERKNGHKIVFIYAVKDDIFDGTSRTKFFDYIATIIPVIDSSNSRDILKAALIEHQITGIPDEVYKELGVFIDDMRILKNIVNEFLQYCCRLDINRLDSKKILAMVLYKNYCPKDFALLHNQDGIVYSIIKNKTKYYNSAVQVKQNEIKALEEELKQIINFYPPKNIKELRTLYVMEYVSRLKLVRFGDGASYYFPSQVINGEDLFDRLMQNELNYYNDGQYSRSFDIKFKDIEKIVDPEKTYLERSSMTPERVREIKEEIEKIQQAISDYRTKPLCEILSNYSADDFYKDVEENHLIAFLLRRGYIDEYYYDYISYFYEGTMTASDREFVLDVKIGKSKDYSYDIQKPKAVIEQIPDVAFCNGLMLNICLLDFIVADKETYSRQWNWINHFIRRKKEFSFIEAFYNESKDPSKFFSEILPLWDNFFSEGILKIKSSTNFEILLRYFPKTKIEQYNNENFKDYLSGMLDFISSKLSAIGLDNIKLLTSEFDIKYKKIATEVKVQDTLMQYIIDGNFYRLCSENVITILSFIDASLAVRFADASYSAIIESENETLIDYVTDHFQDCTKDVFSSKSVNESEEVIISIAENESIEVSVKKSYLSQQLTKIEYLESITKENWNIALESNIISATWKNIEKYILIDTEKDLSSVLIQFIINNSEVLVKQKIAEMIADESIERLFRALIGSAVLPITSYRLIRKFFNKSFNKFDLSVLDADRVDCLIETHGIKFNEYHYALVDKHFTELTPKILSLNKNIYLANISLYPLSSSTAITLLNGTEFTSKEKFTIIQSLPVAMTSENSLLANTICLLLNQTKRMSVSNNRILAIMSGCNKQNQKLLLFVKKCLESTYDEAFVRSGLELLGGDYAIIALQNGFRPKLAKTDTHWSLAEFLEKNAFISTKYEENGMIRINSKNIG